MQRFWGVVGRGWGVVGAVWGVVGGAVGSSTLVGDGGVVAGLVGVVSDGLDASVGEVDEVSSFGIVTITSLRVSEVGTGVVVVDGVVVGVVGGGL